MAVVVDVVPYGEPAWQRLRQLVGQVKRDDPLAPVTIVVPSNRLGVHLRREIAFAPGLAGGQAPGAAGLAIMTSRELLSLLAAGDGTTGPPPSRSQRLGAISALLHEAAMSRPTRFYVDPVAGHPATLLAVDELYRELASCPPSVLDELEARGGVPGDERGVRIVDLYRQLSQRLAAHGSDEATLVELAVARSAAPSAIIGELGTVLVFLPQRLGTAELALFTALGEHRRVHVLAGSVGDDVADAQIRASIDALARHTGDDFEWVRAAETPTGSAVVQVSDPEEEIRHAVEEVLEAAREGVAFDRMAIVYPTDEPYASMLSAELEAAKVPEDRLIGVPLVQTRPGSWLLELLRLASTEFDRQSFFRLLALLPTTVATPPLRSRWERLARDAAVGLGIGRWRQQLVALRDELASRPLEEGAPEGKARQRESDLDALEKLLACLDELEGLGLSQRRWEDWSAAAAWMRGLRDALLPDEGGRQRWPRAEQLAMGRIDELIDDLAGFATPSVAVDIEQFELMVHALVDGVRVRMSVPGVRTGPVASVIGERLELVIVVGLAEGLLPAPVAESALLPDGLREKVNAEHSYLLPTSAQRVARQHHDLLAVLAGAIRSLLLFPAADLRGAGERHPSRWWLDSVARLTTQQQRQGITGDEVAVKVASFEQRLRSSRPPATRQQVRLRRLLSRRGGASNLAGIGDLDAGLDRSLQLSRSRRHAIFDRFNGNLEGRDPEINQLLDLAARPLSPSAVESYLRCPYHFFVSRLLGVAAVEEAAEDAWIDPLTKGTLLHRILERWLVVQLECPDALPVPSDPWSRAARDTLLAISAEEHRAHAATSHLPHAQWQLLEDEHRVHLLAFLDADDFWRSQWQSRPIAAEHELGSVPLELNDRAVAVTGKIDRIDEDANGRRIIIDYKTGSPKDYVRVNTDAPFGIDPANTTDPSDVRLQHAMYAVTLDALGEAVARSGYWFIPGSKPDQATKVVDVNGVLLAATRSLLGRTLASILAGCFPQLPTSGYGMRCRSCDHDGFGSGMNNQRWQRMQNAVTDYTSILPIPSDEKSQV